MSVPVGLGLAFGRLETGFTIGLGALLLADGPSASTAPSTERAPLTALAPAALSVIFATIICSRGWTDPALILLTAMAAAISGYSRPVGVAAVRFIIYLVLSVTLLRSAGDHRPAAALIFGLGALWNMIVRRLLIKPSNPASIGKSAKPARQPTPAQRRRAWRRSLQTLSGWQFPIRIVAGLSVASVLRQVWPSHHFGWIVLTVALLTQRPIEPLPVKTVQRAVGTAAGVALTFALLTGLAAFSASSHIALAVSICLLAVVASMAKARSYLAYSSLSTPVILLVFDFGHPVQTSLLADRLVATILGAGIVVAANIVMDRSVQAASGETSKAAG